MHNWICITKICLGFMIFLILYTWRFSFLITFFDVDHFKVFIEFGTKLLLFLFFWPRGMWILAPQPGIEPEPLALEGEILSTSLPGKSFFFFFNILFHYGLSQDTEYSSLLYSKTLFIHFSRYVYMSLPFKSSSPVFCWMPRTLPELSGLGPFRLLTLQSLCSSSCPLMPVCLSLGSFLAPSRCSDMPWMGPGLGGEMRCQ